MRNIAPETRVRDGGDGATTKPSCLDASVRTLCWMRSELVRYCKIIKHIKSQTQIERARSCLVLMYVLKVLSKDASRMALALGAHGTAVRKQKRLYKIFYLLGWGSVAGTFREGAQKLKSHGQPTEQASFGPSSSATLVAISEASSMRSSP